MSDNSSTTDSSIQFNLEMADFKKHINFAKCGLGTGVADLPVLLFRFTIKGNKVEIFSADKERFCKTEFRVNREDESKEERSFGVLGAKLQAIVSHAESETVQVVVDEESMEVKAGFLTLNLELYDTNSLKLIEAGVSDLYGLDGKPVERAHLEEALVCAKSCTSATALRPEVTHVEMRNGRVFSSDGRKVMIYINSAFSEDSKLKVPASTLTPVISAVKNIPEEHLALSEGKSYYVLNANLGKFILGIRKVERDFPDLESMISNVDKPDDEVSIDKHVLGTMISGVSLSLKEDDVRVSIEVGGKGPEAYLEVSTVNSLNRKSFERGSCGRKNPEKAITFPVSYKHLLTTLSVFKGDSIVDMLILESRKILLIRDYTEAREVMTVIPFRTDKVIQQEKEEKKKKEEKSDSSEKTAVKRISDEDLEGLDVSEIIGDENTGDSVVTDSDLE